MKPLEGDSKGWALRFRGMDMHRIDRGWHFCWRLDPAFAADSGQRQQPVRLSAASISISTPAGPSHVRRINGSVLTISLRPGKPALDAANRGLHLMGAAASNRRAPMLMARHFALS